MFAERYVASLGSSDLRDDDRHHSTEALIAAALADQTGLGLGSLLCRVKYADGTVNKLFEGNSANLALLLRIWLAEVTRKGRERKWIKMNTAWDAEAAVVLYRRVAAGSLAYWLDGKCNECKGAGVMQTRRTCGCCKGSGRAEIQCSGGFERERIMDMVSELEGLVQSHSSRAASMLRRTS